MAVNRGGGIITIVIHTTQMENQMPFTADTRSDGTKDYVKLLRRIIVQNMQVSLKTG
ncbi:MAG: hypothetical protein M3Y25_10305 [Thermoproteota archaeon]|nr:hypothetical protein [Thermoproteota archaeon]